VVRTPPTGILTAVNYDAQLFVLNILRNLGYTWNESYVFGATAIPQKG
jgi:hypothetical protein